MVVCVSAPSGWKTYFYSQYIAEIQGQIFWQNSAWFVSAVTHPPSTDFAQ
jgi:hypothetical protein